jgi:hypothetical protein
MSQTTPENVRVISKTLNVFAAALFGPPGAFDAWLEDNNDAQVIHCVSEFARSRFLIDRIPTNEPVNAELSEQFGEAMASEDAMQTWLELCSEDQIRRAIFNYARGRLAVADRIAAVMREINQIAAESAVDITQECSEANSLLRQAQRKSSSPTWPSPI